MQIALNGRDAWCIVAVMMTFSDIIARWPSAVALAEDIGESEITVRSWKQRNSIPARHWLSIVRAAQKRKVEVGLEDLAQAASSDEGRAA